MPFNMESFFWSCVPWKLCIGMKRSSQNSPQKFPQKSPAKFSCKSTAKLSPISPPHKSPAKLELVTLQLVTLQTLPHHAALQIVHTRLLKGNSISLYKSLKDFYKEIQLL